MNQDNWYEITTSGFAWEREALEYVRRGFPRHAPYAAWANFEFFDGGDRLYEVDLLLCTPKGLHLVEIKSWPGRIEGDDHTWRWTNPEGRTVARDNPLRLANAKARSLKSVLGRTAPGRRGQLPFIAAWVFLSDPTLDVVLTEQGRVNVVGRADPEHRRTGIPEFQTALVDVTPADHERFRHQPGRRLDRPTGELVVGAMRDAHIKPSNRMRTVGEFRLEQLITDGPGFQDFAGRHETLHGRQRRIRIYNAPQSAEDPKRQALRRAARRESELLEGLQHPGLLPIEGYIEHDLGPALVLGITPDRPTLDAWRPEHAGRLSLIEKLMLLREVVDAVRYAHAHGLVHRGLSPRSIFMSEGGKPRIGDWHTGARVDAELDDVTLGGTRDPGALAGAGADAFLAPETAVGADLDTSADVFSLGAIAYLLVANRAPARSAEDLLVLLRESGGLDLAAAIDGVGPRLRDLVRSATAPAVGDRLADAEEFLAYLSDALAEAHDGDADEADPLLADKDDVLTDTLIVERALGAGSTARAVLVMDVERGQHKVLKVALDEDRATALYDEAEVLAAVAHPAIVRSEGLVRIGGRTALVLQYASEGTVARRLREEGPFGLDLLARLGVDLLQALVHLEREGYLHRDVKPDNLGLAPAGKNDELHLLLLDFSLSRADPSSLRAGTPNYVDPFLGLGVRNQFDAAADRWAAAVTLHEMAAGRRPQRGDGRSHPAATGDEVVPALDVVDPTIRPRLHEFLARALRSDVTDRFDTAQEMLDAWRAVFASVAAPAVPTATTPEDVDALLDAATLATPLAAAGLSIQQVAALERHNVVTVEDLVLLPGGELSRLRGMGNRMRRELMAVTGRLRRSLADEIIRVGLSRAASTTSTADEPDAPDVQGLDALVLQLAPERAPDRKSLRVQRLLLSLPAEPGGTPAPLGPWPTTRDLAERSDHSLAESRMARDAGVRRWAKLPAITRLRASLVSELERFGGVATADELAIRVLALRGSVVPDRDLRHAFARAATRAAIEVEVARGDDSRVTQRRDGDRVLLSATTLGADPQALMDRASALADEADRIVAEERMLAPSEVIARLHGIDAQLAEVALMPARLLALAAAASRRAAVSPRGELYPVGLPAARAVALAQGALLGAKELSFAEARERIAARYPEAEALPERPAALEALLQQNRVDLTWRTDPSRKEGGVFLPAALPIGLTGVLGSTSMPRGQTTGSAVDARRLEAAEFDRVLQTARRDGGAFIVQASPREVSRVAARLVAELDVELVDVERFVLQTLRRLSEAEGIDWSLLVRTDVDGPGSPQWGSMLNVFGEVFDALVERVSAVDGVPLLYRAGVLARYGGMKVFGRLRASGVHGWWLLVAQDDQAGRPLLDGATLEVRGDFEWTRVPPSWIQARTSTIAAA